MTEADAKAMVEELMRRDPDVATAIAAMRARGIGWEEIARRAARAAERIAREVP